MSHTFVIFSPIPYHYLYQREQAFADTLINKGHRIIFIEEFSTFIDFHMDERVNREPIVKKYSKDFTVVHCSHVFPFISLKSEFVRKVVGRLLRVTLLKKLVDRRVLAVLENVIPDESIGMVTTPNWWRLAKRFTYKTVVYDCIDDPDVLRNTMDTESYFLLVSDLCERAEHIMVTAEVLEKKLLGTGVNPSIVFRVANGVFLEKFRNVEADTSVQKLAEGYRAVIGFTGAMYQWFDDEIIGYCAERLPDYKFVLAGPYLEKVHRNLSGFPNILFLGSQPFEKIPGLIQSFHICLSPFKLNEIGESTNPVKLYEYLALGKPVVSTEIYELKFFEGLVSSAKTKDAFLEKIKEALQLNSKELEIKRMEFAKRNTWNSRVETLLARL